MTRVNDYREIADYADRLLAALQPDSAAGRALAEWLKGHDEALGFRFARTIAARGKRTSRAAGDKALSPAAWRRLAAAVAAGRATQSSHRIARNVRLLGGMLALSDRDETLLSFVALATGHAALRHLCETLTGTRLLYAAELTALATGVAVEDVATAVSAGPLATLGLVMANACRLDEFHFYVPFEILTALRTAKPEVAELERLLLGAPILPTLTWNDFDHIAAERDFATRLLRGAARTRASGINLLIHGVPGTGKTELAKLLAKHAELSLYPVGETDSDNEEPSRYDRLCALRLGDRLLSARNGGCLLFDEMEDMLRGGTASYSEGRRFLRTGSKVFLNRLLERNVVPVIWISNALDEFDRAFLRRMSMVIELKVPPRQIRARQWVRLGSEIGLPLPPQMAAELAETNNIPPALARTALTAVRTAGLQPDALQFVVGGLSKAATGARPRDGTRRTRGADRALFNTDCDLAAVEFALSRGRHDLGVLFCLHGPSGTGKSIFARRLAELAGLEPLERRGSDFLSKWVGETEARIAQAFDQAREDRQFLIIDEVESLLWDRRGATRSWETSMVNEFLTWLEAHPLPLACTTNHMEQIDSAVLRRFTFKIKFDCLKASQLPAAFASFFEMSAPAALCELDGITLGDFSTVEKQLRFLERDAREPEAIVAALAREAQARSGAFRRIGF